MAGRRLKPGWKLLGGARRSGSRSGSGFRELLRGLDFFRVRRVEIAGLQYLDPAKVIARAEARRRRPACSTIPRRSRAGCCALPGVHVGRGRPPAAGNARDRAGRRRRRWRSRAAGDGLALLDARGRVLPFDPLRSAPDLPCAADGDAVVAGVLARVRDYDPDLFARIGAAWRVGPDVVLEVGGRRLWFGAQVSAEDIRAVMAVEQALARQGRPYQELDGRFAGQVIVRRARA